MKKEIIACDFLDDGDKECRRFAESSCAICHKDGCYAHLIMALALTFSTKSPPRGTDPRDAKSKEPLYSEQEVVHALQLCVSCSTRVNRIMFDQMRGALDTNTLEGMLKALIEETKAILAEKALRAVGEPPR